MLSVGRRRLLSTEGFVFGQVADKALDMTRVRVGQKLDVPYELTISTGFRDIWHSTFYQHDRVYTSDSYARSLGFDQALLPFSMLLSITGSMTHVDDRLEVLDLGFRNAVYRRPAYPGDTFYKTFYISGIRETSESQNSIVTVHCDLSDANTSETVFSVDKIMMYPIQRRQNTYAAGEPSHTHFNSQVKDQIVSNYSYMSTSSTLSGLTPGQLLLHGMCRPMGRSTAMELATLLRWTHPLLYNLKRYDFDELVVAGGLVLASAHACSARSLYEVLSEELIDCSLLKRVHANETLGAMTYVSDIRELNDKLEEATIVTLGVKDTDIARELVDVQIPLSLFTQKNLRPHEYDVICEKYCPSLAGNIVSRSTRRVLRQAPQNQSIFLL